MQVEPPQSDADSSLLQYQALLEITQVIATHHDLSSLFHDLTERLRSVVQFDLLGVSLYDPVSHQMRLRLFETPLADLPAPPEEYAVDDSLAGWICPRISSAVLLSNSITGVELTLRQLISDQRFAYLRLQSPQKPICRNRL